MENNRFRSHDGNMIVFRHCYSRTELITSLDFYFSRIAIHSNDKVQSISNKISNTFEHWNNKNCFRIRVSREVFCWIINWWCWSKYQRIIHVYLHLTDVFILVDSPSIVFTVVRLRLNCLHIHVRSLTLSVLILTAVNHCWPLVAYHVYQSKLQYSGMLSFIVWYTRYTRR